MESFLASSVHSFLIRNGFSSQDRYRDAQAKSRKDGSPSPRKRRKVDFEGDSGYAEVVQKNTLDNLARDISSPSPLYIRDVSLMICIELSLPTQSPQENTSFDQDQDDGHHILWTDPNTGEVFIVDGRTGNSRPRIDPNIPVTGEATTSSYAQRRTLSRSAPESKRNEMEPKPSMPDWIQKALEVKPCPFTLLFPDRKKHIVQPSICSK